MSIARGIAILAFAGHLTLLAHADFAAGKVSCYSYREKNEAYKKKLWDGYEISLGPSSDLEAVESKCTAAIYNRTGKAVFRTSGFSVVFDEDETGEDFDGDGKPEVVFETDTGGGNHCCWAYNVVSLSPRPHRLFDIPGAAQFEKDAQGNMIIWERRGGTGAYTSMAQQPFANRVFRVRTGKLVDVTPDFCPTMVDEHSRVLTPESLKRIQSNTDADTEEVVSALLSRALQHVFCREFDQALGDLNLWPETSRAHMKADFAMSIKDDYPEFAVRLNRRP